MTIGHGVEGVSAVLLAFASLYWCFCLATKSLRLLPRWIVRIEWRISAILIATCFSIVLTLIGFLLDLQVKEPSSFTKDVFAGWVGSVGFFALVGLTISIVSIVNAADDAFDARAHIFVRNKTGPHVDDFIARLRGTLAHYAQSVVRELTVIEFDEPSQMYRVRAKITSVLHSYVDDIETVYASSVSYRPDHPPPPGRFHRLASIHGVTCDETPIDSATSQPIDRAYTAKVAPGGAAKVEVTLDFWVLAGQERIAYSPIRFSLLTTITICSELGRPLIIRSQWQDAAETRETLLPGQAAKVWQRRNLKQAGAVHTFFLNPP